MRFCKLKKILAALGFLTSLLLIGSPLALAVEEPDECLADTLQLPDVAKKMEAADKNFIATEIYEPIGGLDQKIKAGELTVSQVFWKFNCTTTETSEWLEGDEPKKTPTEDGKPITVSGYLPYTNESGQVNNCPVPYNQCSIVQIIIGQSGSAILKTYVAIIYRWAAGIVGIVAVLVIVISGIQISMDQGSGEGLSAAKTRIMQALTGLVILFLSSVILYTINPTFFK